MIGASETVVTMICMDEMLQRQAIQAMNGRAYYSLQTSDIHEVYRKLSTMGVTDGPCREQNGVNMFHVTSPEGLTIRISEKELVQVG